MKKKRTQSRDPERTRAGILDAATLEFANRGLHGARLDAIAARTRTTKRMIYYYFGGSSRARDAAKDHLFGAVIEKAYADLRLAEEAVTVDGLAPRDALLAIAAFLFDYYDAHPEFVRLVITENIHEARHLKRSRAMRGYASAIVPKLAAALEAGAASGEFRRGIDPMDVLLYATSIGFYRVAGRYTWTAVVGADLSTDTERTRHSSGLGDLLLGYVAARPAA